MNTASPNPVLDKALTAIPAHFRGKLISAYTELKKNYLESRYDMAGLAAGKLSEVVLRILQEKITGSYTPFGAQVSNYADECRKLISAPAIQGNESERVVLPRALVFLYTMRNKRGIGHVGGDVDANSIDLATMTRTADWIICELIRINHGYSLEEAQDIVDGLSIRQMPVIWEVGGKKRVLKEGLKAKDEVLLLLYSDQTSGVLLEDLCDWVEYSNPRVFKSKVIAVLHKGRLLEFDKDSESVVLSPKGVEYVEKTLMG
jgi:hypothetical protein